MLGIAIRCIQHFQAMLERGVCELAQSLFHYKERVDIITYILKEFIDRNSEACGTGILKYLYFDIEPQRVDI